ncbi:MAG TPA: DUF3500 domain-containing protein [Thermoanaerobaculia bacterium]|nr:DUF3500 domain-containing protein [Thermoanaerobaculia bacterium]
MTTPRTVGFTVVLVSALFLTAPSSGADAPAHAVRMAGAARAFLATLAPAKAAKARYPFEAKERFDWAYVPKVRAGLPLKAMAPAQQEAALALLKAGLSEKGYAKVETIRSLEGVLAGLEGSSSRDPDLYTLAVFGEPSESGIWGLRYEGHHVSLNWTFVAGRSIASTPQFLGANPAEVKDGPLKGTRALAAEEDLGRAFVKALDAERRSRAVVSTSAPADILTGSSRRAATQGDGGLAWNAMTAEQQARILRLLEEHANAQRPELAAARMDRLRAAGLPSIRFAWMGGLEKGQGHYYRIQGATFLVEYDDTQNGANHVHAVWRDFDGDFGEDLLAEHYRNAPHR